MRKVPGEGWRPVDGSSAGQAEPGADRLIPAPPRAATIYDVASAAGVSHQTVSRLLNGVGGVRPANRDRIVQALRELDYRPNKSARNLATRESQHIAVLTHEITQVGPATIAKGATARAREAGFILDTVVLDTTDPVVVARAVAEANRQEVAGILAFASTDELVSAFGRTEFRVPAVLGTEHDEFARAQASPMSATAVQELIDHLVLQGHRGFFHVAGPPTWAAARNRERAFARALAAHGLGLTGTVHGDWSARSGHGAIPRSGLPAGTTAVLASNDQMAIGAVLALSEQGLAVPSDISVTGIDDIPEAAFVLPPLTTLRVNFEQQGRDVMSELLALIRGEEAPRHGAPEAALRVRRSTGPARGS